MFDRVCLVHYHELGLKGHNRFQFERLLRENIDAALESFPVEPGTRLAGRLCVKVVDPSAIDAIAARIAEIPGVAGVSVAWRTSRETGEMLKGAEIALKSARPFDTFKVASRRSNTDYPIDSMALNQMFGAHLCKVAPDATVRMKDPDVTVSAQVIQGSAYFYVCTLKGVGGLPAGSGGKVVSLLSAGIDSPVASWRMMRRGAIVVGLHFSGRPQTSDASEHLVFEIGEVLQRTGGLGRIYVVAFGDIQREISLVAPPDLRVILYRRLMFAVAEQVARREHAKALVTGESLGQVASQTLDNIRAVDDVAELPVLRPLIGNDKQEIIDEAQRIETFEISSRDHTDCCTLFMPRNPETHARLARVQKVWRELPIEEMVQQALGLMEYRDFSSPAYVPPTDS